MKNLLTIKNICVICFLFASFASAEIVFKDTFNNIPGSGDINMGNTGAGRQFGTLAPLDYSVIGTTEVGVSAANPNKLSLSGTGSACSPNQRFESSGNFKIECELQPTPSGLAITFGKSSQNLAPNSVGGFGVIFYGDGSGRYDVYVSSTLLGTFTNDVVKSSKLNVLISCSTYSFENETAYIALFGLNGYFGGRSAHPRFF